MFGKSVPSRQEVNLEILSAVEDLFRCCIPHVICVLNPVSLSLVMPFCRQKLSFIVFSSRHTHANDLKRRIRDVPHSFKKRNRLRECKKHKCTIPNGAPGTPCLLNRYYCPRIITRTMYTKNVAELRILIHLPLLLN